MTNLGLILRCWLFGHNLYESDYLSENARRVKCQSCVASWAVHRHYGWFKWNDSFDKFYDRAWRMHN